jgi:hypothetical protein
LVNPEEVAMTRPAGATPLGQHLYLFKSSKNTTDCIISAHGGRVFDLASFKVPQGVELKFFGPDTSVLLDPGIVTFDVGRAKANPVETIPGGKRCKDYLLTKFQGRHSKVGETYEVIKDTVEFTDDNPSGSANVVTVRNRWDVVLGVPLSVVVFAVLKEMPTITCFYCAFCRADQILGIRGYPTPLGKLIGLKHQPSVEVIYNC